jgi:hypothetical protein
LRSTGRPKRKLRKGRADFDPNALREHEEFRKVRPRRKSLKLGLREGWGVGKVRAYLEPNAVKGET